MSLGRAIPVFSIVFMIAYAVAMHFNLAPFSYYPVSGRFVAGVGPTTPALGPAMYWYGWLVVALAVALVLGALAAVLPEKTLARLAVAAPWLAILAIAFFLWDLHTWFIR